MRKISARVHKEIDDLPRMKQCAVADEGLGLCSGRIEWHHVWLYAGRQIDEPWAILGACKHHHDRVNKERKVKEAFERKSLKLATTEDLSKYHRKDWLQIIRYLFSAVKETYTQFTPY